MGNLNPSSKSSYHTKKSLKTAERCRNIDENHEIFVEKRKSGRMIESERRASYRFYYCEVFLQKMPMYFIKTSCGGLFINAVLLVLYRFYCFIGVRLRKNFFKKASLRLKKLLLVLRNKIPPVFFF